MDKKSEILSNFLNLFFGLIFINFLILLSFASARWCFPLVKNSSDFDLILFNIGIGSSVGILSVTILYGLLAVVWGDIENLFASYFYSGTYFSITIGGFSGVLGGIICASVSIFLESN
jgi:hypothetical protein